MMAKSPRFLSALIIAGLAVSCAKAKQVDATAAKDSDTTASLALSPDGTKALAQLKQASMFADPYVGIAGSPSKEVIAFVTVLNDPAAPGAFRDLYANATGIEGKLYGLCGLWHVDPAAFKRGVEELRGSDLMAQTMSGCIIGREAVGGMIHSKTPGRVVLDSRDDTIKAWLKRQPEEPQSYSLDIEGGGTPFMMGEQRNNPKFRFVDSAKQ
ncbi:hypothetical protein IT570_00015 [Candidatus Sumerlaeota bacterium]|nr:hypothetical protein [Candidatus Sumerlaeota bacterium]